MYRIIGKTCNKYIKYTHRFWPRSYWMIEKLYTKEYKNSAAGWMNSDVRRDITLFHRRSERQVTCTLIKFLEVIKWRGAARQQRTKGENEPASAPKYMHTTLFRLIECSAWASDCRSWLFYAITFNQVYFHLKKKNLEKMKPTIIHFILTPKLSSNTTRVVAIQQGWYNWVVQKHRTHKHTCTHMSSDSLLWEIITLKVWCHAEPMTMGTFILVTELWTGQTPHDFKT